MNTRRNLIIVKDKIKTAEIRSCTYNNNTHTWDIIFNNSNKIFSYAWDNVEWLKEPQVLNPSLYKITHAGRELYDIDAIYVKNSEKI